MIRLHGFFRSSASWRVRIALALKGLDYEQTSYSLRRGDQRSEAFLKLNPQGLVPALEIDGVLLTQSLAICEYLDATRPEPPLLPSDPFERARVQAFALAVACEIHPVQNLKMLLKLQSLGQDPDKWAREVNHEGLASCAALLPKGDGAYCFGDAPTLADICLVPQMYNARRFGVNIVWENLARVEAACLALPAFRDTAPETQPDFV
jgi:maleylpyruvate isomerase